MSRFFKSAAFPILIVVVLAFLAVKLVNPGSSNHRPHSYQTLVGSELPKGEEKYEAGFVDQAAPELLRELRAAGVRYNVESEKSSALLGLLTYIIPFVLFFGFW